MGCAQGPGLRQYCRMDLDEFITKLAPHVAWPLAVLLLSILFVIVLGRPIINLISEISTFKLSKDGFEISREFRKASDTTQAAVRDIKEDVSAKQSEASATVEGGLASADRGNPWLDDAEASPAVAILRGWEGLASSVGALAETLSGQTPSTVSAALKQLVDGDIVNRTYVRAVEELRQARNEVAHARHVPNRAEAISFITSAWDLVRATQAISAIRQPPESESSAT